MWHSDETYICTFIGHECQSFNIDQTTLTCTVPSPRSDIFISIGAFHELCIYKNKPILGKMLVLGLKRLYLQKWKWSVLLTEWNTCSKKSINFINHIRKAGKLMILKLWNICNFSNSWMKLCLLQQVRKEGELATALVYLFIYWNALLFKLLTVLVAFFIIVTCIKMFNVDIFNLTFCFPSGLSCLKEKKPINEKWWQLYSQHSDIIKITCISHFILLYNEL